MTLWIAWSALISAFVAIAAAASARASAYLSAPRRFVWMGAMIASAVVPLVLALQPAPLITPSSPASSAISPTVALSPSTARVTSGRSAGSDRTPVTTHIADRPALGSVIAALRSLSGGVSRWVQWRGEIMTRIASVQLNAHLADAWIARAWALTSFILFLAFVRASIVLARQRSQWREVETDIGRVLVARDAGPAVVGFVRPRIVIPEWALSIERSTRDLLLRHELEHIQAGDSRALLAAEVLLICAPWNAALWWMARQLRLAIEIDCDARVIRSAGRMREYALVLLAVGERYASAIPLSASLSEPRSNLEARIDAMTEPRLRRPVLAALPFVALAGVVLIASAWMPRPTPLLIAPLGTAKESVQQPEFRAKTLGENLDFRAKVLGENRYKTLADYKGQVVLLNVWATWCPPCRAEMPSLERLYEAYGDKGLKLVAVSVDDYVTEDSIRAYANNLGITFEILHDSTHAIERLYQTAGDPEAFVIDREGTIRKKWIGPADWSSQENRAFVAELLGVQPPPQVIQESVTAIGSHRPPAVSSRDLGHPVVARDPKPLPGNRAPRYPDALRANGAEGRVLLTFSTDARGVPDTTTINVIESTNDQFTNAIRRVLPNWRYDSPGRVRFACRFITLETQQKEAAARSAKVDPVSGEKLPPTFTIEGVAVLPVVVVSAENGQRSDEARRLRSRLEQGDFQEGDRILVEVEGANIVTKPETLVVRSGKNGKHLEFSRMADLTLEGVLRAELQERLTQHLAQYLKEPLFVRATPIIPEGDHRDPQAMVSNPVSAAVDRIAARLASLEIERLSWLAGEPTNGAPQNDADVQIDSLREQLRRLPERDSATRVVDARVAAALDARESELKGRLQQARLVYTDQYPVVRSLAKEERLVAERKAELRRTNP